MTEIYLGPPGTGKTTKLIGLVQDELARGTKPDRIGYVSFTRRAAQEAVDRASEKFGLTRKDLPHFSTLHSLCFRQLGMKRGSVLEGEKLQQFARHAGVAINGKWSEDGTLSGFGTGDRILFMENLARIRGVKVRALYDSDDDRLNWSEVLRVVKALRAYKAAHGLMDYTDMLADFVSSGINLHLDVLLVDESQDLSPLQWLVVEALARGCRRVAVAGDDDQAIYPWAGADVDHLIDMTGDVSVLDQSYRVPPAVQALAGEIIGHVGRRREKTWRARTGEDGAVERAVRFSDVAADDQQREGTQTPPVLVLARNTYVLREQVEPELRRRGIVYERHGHSSISPTIFEVIRNWERLRRSQEVEVSAIRKIYAMMSVDKGFRRGFKELRGHQDDDRFTIDELTATGGLITSEPWHEALDRLPQSEVGYIRAALARGEKLTKRPRVVVSTIHGSKGGEADHVILMKEMASRTHHEMRKRPEDEARVWYVGATRARQRLTIVESSTQRRCPWI